MNPLVSALAIALLVPLGSVHGAGPNSGPAEPVTAYGSKVHFTESKPIHFREFTLTFTGKKKVTPPQYPGGWWVYHFTTQAGAKSQDVVWSAGTGDIGPSRFTVKGSEFDLELVHSDRLGKLAEDELVVTPVKP